MVLSQETAGFSYKVRCFVPTPYTNRPKQFMHCYHQCYLFGIISIVWVHLLRMLYTALFICILIFRALWLKMRRSLLYRKVTHKISLNSNQIYFGNYENHFIAPTVFLIKSIILGWARRHLQSIGGLPSKFEVTIWIMK